MTRVFESPLITILFLVNVTALMLVGATYLMPLPSVGDRGGEAEHVSAGHARALQQQTNITAVLERPLFHANRRRPAKAKVVAAPVAVPKRIEAPYQLVGVVGASDDNRTAYLQHSETQETVVARVGQDIGTWHVESIGTNFVTLTSGEERRVIQLAGGQ